MSLVAVGAGLLLLLIANAHLVYVAITSQPDCVAHVRQGEGAAQRRKVQRGADRHARRDETAQGDR